MPEQAVERKLTPDFVYEQWRKTEERRKRQHSAMRKAKFAYESRLWKGESNDAAIQASNDEGPVTGGGGKVLVEVSRMPGIIQTFTGFLFPRSPRTVVSPDAEGVGDPSKAELVLNRWFATERIHRKFSNAIGQALLYRGCAIKLGVDMTKRRPLDRVWCKVVPWWDLILDWDVQDLDEVRFIGHEYWEDVAVFEKRLGEPLPEGTPMEYRVPYFDKNILGDRSQTQRAPGNDAPETGRFVRVLEWYNFVDDFVTKTGKIRGTFEIYLVSDLNKGGTDRVPLKQYAMPYTAPDGEPCPAIFPLLFDSEMEHPLRGIAFSDRVYSQCYEMALLRTFEANALRRDARVALYDKGAPGLDDTALSRITQGEDGAFVGIELGQGKTFEKVFYPIQFPPINSDHQVYEAAIEKDLNQGANVPKFTRGESMGSRTTAYEVKQLNQYMENRLGEMARTKDSWITEVARGFLRVLIMVLKAPQLLPGARAKELPDSVSLKTGRKDEKTAVEVKDLDAEFEIGVVDSASTPMSREAKRLDMKELMPTLMELWAKIEEGNPMAVTLLKTIVDLYDLSADFDVRALQTLADQLAVENEARAKAKKLAEAEKIADAAAKAKRSGKLPDLQAQAQLPGPVPGEPPMPPMPPMAPPMGTPPGLPPQAVPPPMTPGLNPGGAPPGGFPGV